MKKNTFLAVLLSMIVLGGWMYIEQKLNPPDPKLKEKQALAAKQKQEKSAKTETTTTNDAYSHKTGADLGVEVVSGEDSPKSEQRYTVETDIVKAVFTNRGGDIVSFKLKEHAFAAEQEERVEMIYNVNENNRALSLSFGSWDAQPINDFFNVKTKNLNDGKKQIGFYKDFKVKNAGGDVVFTLAKIYTFIPGDYMFTLDVIIEGKDGMKGLSFGNQAYTLRSAPQIGPEWKSNDRYEYRSLSYFANESKESYNKINAGKVEIINDLASWVSISGKYFAFIVVPKDPIQKMVFSGEQQQGDAIHNSQFFIYRPAISGNIAKDQYRVYIGPSSEKLLHKYNTAVLNNYGYENLRVDAVAASSGILRPLEQLLKWVMEALYQLIPNWGVSVLLLTLILRILFFPLTKKSSKATKRMQELQPRITEIQNKYKNNPQKMNAEMGKFYKEAGYNPLSGCLPMLIQIPFFFAMFRLFRNYFEFRGASFIPGWIPDLSVGDSILKLSFQIPLLGWDHIRLLPVIYLVSQLLYGKITQTPQGGQNNKQMKIMLYGMPIFFFFVLYNTSAGLLLFWTFSNMLMLVQQVIINKSMQKQGK